MQKSCQNHVFHSNFEFSSLEITKTINFKFRFRLSVKTTPFPFPLVQIIYLMMITICLVAPILMRAFTEDFWLGLISSWLITYGCICLSELSAELEMPFGDDENDHPLKKKIIKNAKNHAKIMFFDSTFFNKISIFLQSKFQNFVLGC